MYNLATTAMLVKTITTLGIWILLISIGYFFIFNAIKPDKNIRRLAILMSGLLFYTYSAKLITDTKELFLPIINYIVFGGMLLLTSIIIPLYSHRWLKLKEIKFISTYGSLILLVMPVCVIFIATFFYIGDLDICRKNISISIAVYFTIYLLFLSKGLTRWKRIGRISVLHKKNALWIYAATFAWIIGLVIPAIINLPFALGQLISISGWLAVSIIFVYKSIGSIKDDYSQLEKLKLEVNSMNDTLRKKVIEHNKELIEANRQRADSFINFAHEVKTPVTLIINYFNQYVKKFGSTNELEMVRKNMEWLKMDVSAYFNAEILHKGMEIFNHEQVTDLSDMVKSKGMMFTYSASLKSIELLLDIDNKLFVKADPVAVDSVLNNLFDNALKFTPELGKIFIGLKSLNDSVMIFVTDTGEGISEQDKDKIFDPFYHNQDKKFAGSIGVGLSIVKKIVDSLGGRISLRSRVNNGSEFMVEIPRHYLHKEDELSNYQVTFPSKLTTVNDIEMPGKGHHDKDCSILIIEDNPYMLFNLKENFISKYNVYTATNGVDALEKLNQMEHPDLIISDIVMPDMDGIEFLQTIKNEEAWNYIPFIFLTGVTRAEDKIKGLNYGAVDFILKPFEMDVLKAKVDSVIRIHRLQQDAFFSGAKELLFSQMKRRGQKLMNAEQNLELKCRKYQITGRQKEIIFLLVEGRTYKEIGDALNITEKTVGVHLQNIYKKVGVNNKAELINLIYKHSAD